MIATLKNFGLLLGYYLFQGLIFTILFYKASWFNSHSLLNWDAQHYYKITTEGYDYTRTAFFPLFPLIWKYSGLGLLAISVFNGLLFLGSFAWLSSLYKINWKLLLIIASVPSFIFFFVPYTESVFFAGSVLLLTGYKKADYRFVFVGLLVASFARPAASVFLPAIILLEILTRTSTTDAAKKISLSTAALVLGMVAAFAVHRYFTGNWLGFFEVQQNVWENRLQIPSLPLRSWAGIKIVILDGTALFVCLLSAWQLLKWFIPNLKSFKINQEKGLVFSLFYLTGIGLLVLLYRDGSLFSLNRFSFATAFFVVVAGHFGHQKFENRALFWITGMLVWWLLFNSYVHIATFSKHLLITAFLSLTVLAFQRSQRISAVAMPLLFIGFSLLQLYLLYRHLSNLWVG
jgi:hypothetical protein